MGQNTNVRAINADDEVENPGQNELINQEYTDDQDNMNFLDQNQFLFDHEFLN